MRIKKILSLLFLLATAIIQAQEVKQWTLRECIEHALEHNITIQQSELNLLNAEIDKFDALGNFIPTLNGQVSFVSSTGLTQDPTTNSLVNQTLFSITPNVSSSLTLFDGLRNFHTLN